MLSKETVLPQGDGARNKEVNEMKWVYIACSMDDEEMVAGKPGSGCKNRYLSMTIRKQVDKMHTEYRMDGNLIHSLRSMNA